MQVDPQHIAHIPNACLVKARALYPTLKRAERSALDYLLAHPQQVAGATIGEAARAAGCSEASLFRLARRLGYEGFPALKAAFGGVESPHGGVVYRGITAADDPLSVVEKVFAASVQSLQDTLGILDRAEYGKAVQAVVGARRLLFCGIGDAALVGVAMAQKFVRVNIDARAEFDPDAQLVAASHLQPGDVAVGISHSGRTVTVLNTLREARKRGATAIAVTNYPMSAAAKAADIVLLTADFAEHLNGEVVSKRVSEHCVLESLYINTLIARSAELAPAQRRADEALTVYKA
jgi:RpiR family transcriptional regulator, carbohydrate utilization regulator